MRFSLPDDATILSAMNFIFITCKLHQHFNVPNLLSLLMRAKLRSRLQQLIAVDGKFLQPQHLDTEWTLVVPSSFYVKRNFGCIKIKFFA